MGADRYKLGGRCLVDGVSWGVGGEIIGRNFGRYNGVVSRKGMLSCFL